MLGAKRRLLAVFFLLATNSARCAQSLPAKILLYSATQGFRHDSIPVAIQALQSNQSSINVVFDSTEDQTQFSDQNLANYDAIMFLSTTGEVLDDNGKAAFQKYLDLGGNFVAVHSASDSLVNTTFFGHEIGAFFDYHPDLQNATVDVIGPSHPSTRMLPAEWQVQDEIYNFKSDPRSIGAIVILAANESSYIDTGVRKFDQGTPHPLAWFQEHGAGAEDGTTKGRSFYTSLGHLNETWQHGLYLAHVLGGIQWTLQANTTRAFNSSALVGNSGSSSSNSNGSTSTSASPESSSAPVKATPISYTLVFFVALLCSLSL
ncbi:class I glutamine amidotransferase-like protein [Mycena floridula]|nr:class I glutamine amidotransferase-like protein [Mycena floridula]